MGDVVQFRRGRVQFEAQSCDSQEPYRFPEKDVARSSSGVLVSQGDNIACPTCGCRDPRKFAGQKLAASVTETQMKPGCRCKCHDGRSENPPSTSLWTESEIS